MFAPPDAWLDAFTTTVNATLRRCGAVRNCCVEACCVGVGVAREWGYLAEPLPVAVQVRNMQRRQATVIPGPDGTSRRRDGFAGHLVLYFPAAQALVDPTADQFHDPARGLLVPEPVWLHVTRDDLATGLVGELPGGTTLGYQLLPDDVSWRALEAWTGSSAVTTGLAIRALRDALSTGSRGRPVA